MTTKTKKTRTNTPRERGVYKSYSLRILKRDLDKFQKRAKREKISFNTWMNAALAEKYSPTVPPAEPSYSDLAKEQLEKFVEVANGDDSLQV